MPVAPGKIKTAVLIGAGNVGWHLGHLLFQKGYSVLQVISRTESSCRELATRLHAGFSTRLDQLHKDAGIIIIAVPDGQISKVISRTDFGNSFVVHTAGSVPMEVFRGKAVHYGVLYPLMTFTRNKPVDYSAIPLLIEANTDENVKKLLAFAKTLSEEVRPVSSETRKILHLAAVFACNFPNHMVALAEHLLSRNGIAFGIMKPLIRETADKLNTMSPLSAQTGPAMRNDRSTMANHLKLLSDEAEIAGLYRQISKSIITFTAKKISK